MNSLEKFARAIDKKNKKLALGYESTLDFNYGYISCLWDQKLISIKEKNALVLVYASDMNGDCRWAIQDGKLIDYGET